MIVMIIMIQDLVNLVKETRLLSNIKTNRKQTKNQKINNKQLKAKAVQFAWKIKKKQIPSNKLKNRRIFFKT